MVHTVPALGPDLDSCISDLKRGAARIDDWSFGQQSELIDRCAAKIPQVAEFWLQSAWRAKRVGVDDAAAAEDILSGPATLLRYLRLLSGVLRDVEKTGYPRFPGRPTLNSLGNSCVPVMPAAGLFDHLLFRGIRADVWFDREIAGPAAVSRIGPPEGNRSRINGLLGAGNVSAIPATDMLFKIFQQGEAVLLKMSPVNEYLKPVFEELFQPLIQSDLLRIICGGDETGKALVEHPDVDSIHITGSHLTHDAIVWGADPDARRERKLHRAPSIDKEITSELGNVTPWIIVPGQYTDGQLRSQASHIASSIVNNASFNCLATKVIVTSRNWPQRSRFLDLIENNLKLVSPRFAYYPGAKERFAQVTGSSVDGLADELPWTLIRGVNPDTSAHFFEEESFVCVCAETALGIGTPVEFLDAAVAFVNERLFGTLCASITVPDLFHKSAKRKLELAISKMRYGSVCINQWSGLAYGLMSPPWGGYRDATLENPQSGIGHVHNVYGLRDFDKTVLWGPLRSWPKPVWFASHRSALSLARALQQFYQSPSLLRLPKLFWYAGLG